VKDGLDYCKGRKLHIIRGSDNIIKEIKAYSYKMRKDASGESVSTDEPVKFMDDAMDAMRYSRASMRMQYQASVKSSVSKGDPLMDILDARNIETRRDSRLGFYAG
jgi:hypothetical protein